MWAELLVEREEAFLKLHTFLTFKNYRKFISGNGYYKVVEKKNVYTRSEWYILVRFDILSSEQIGNAPTKWLISSKRISFSCTRHRIAIGSLYNVSIEKKKHLKKMRQQKISAYNMEGWGETNESSSLSLSPTRTLSFHLPFSSSSEVCLSPIILA